MSDAVERRIVTLLSKPLVCPHGNPIPGLEELGLAVSADNPGELVSLTSAARGPASTVMIDRISEQLQPDAGLMRKFALAGLRPGQVVQVAPTSQGVEVWDDEPLTDATRVTFDRIISDHIFVRSA